MKSENSNKEEKLEKIHEEEQREPMRIARDNYNPSRSRLAIEIKKWHYVGLIFIVALSSIFVLSILCTG